jgi:hypothetical protein
MGVFIIKLWIDEVRPAPEGYMWCKSVNGAKHRIRRSCEELISNPQLEYYKIELIDIGYNTKDFTSDGDLLDWLEQTGRNYPIRIHSMNPVGVANMQRIIERNGWKEVF